jgi:hypothetical protein
MNIIAYREIISSRHREQPFPPRNNHVATNYHNFTTTSIKFRPRAFFPRALHYAVDVIDGYKFLGFINFYCRARRYPLVVAGRMKESGDG